MANPMYRQIAEDLRQQIESGELDPGSQLPTELELRERYNASRNTVRDAIKWLINLGLVATRPGQGTFVVEKIDPFVTKLSGDPRTGFGGGEGTSYLSEVSEGNRKPTTGRIRVEIQEAAPDIAEKLGNPAGSVADPASGLCTGQVGPGPGPGVLRLEPDGAEGVRVHEAGIAADEAAVNVVGDGYA